MLECLYQLPLFGLSQNTMKIALEKIRVLDMYARHIAAPQLIENTISRVATLSDARGSNLLAPFKIVAIEHNEMVEELWQL
jgi:hypothetical protein